MSRLTSAELPQKVYAEAVLSSAIECAGESYLQEQCLFQAVRRLRNNGFEVIDIGKFSITIAASPEVYWRSLQISLQTFEESVIKGFGISELATFIRTTDNQNYINLSQSEWRENFAALIINEPLYYFDEARPSPDPPLTSSPYLSVPEGLANALNATPIHQQGIKGKGVNVVMVDSGWYRHPFFEKHGYQVDVRLAPGSSDETTDALGHGTGESANVLAIAPDVSLTMVKADICLPDGQFKNINSISGFRTAVALKPDIITCSWGSDQRSPHLSAPNRLLAQYVADAVRQGIIVIFAAGNGHYGFPAQHREVIAAGGVYQHLDGALRGQLEASSYASGFISPVYSGREVPDLCGLVGHLPYGRYLMLPVPRGLEVDQREEDGTARNDGWAVFSGTSAAAPQLAGVCALMKQVNPNLSPAQVKAILKHTAHDVVNGFSNPASGGAAARAGPDLATGSGLVDAYRAVQMAKGLTNSKCCDDGASPTQNFSNLTSISNRRKTMSEFPKLQKKLDELRWKFEKELQSAISEYGLEDVELSELNFVERSSITKVAYPLRKTLGTCVDQPPEGKEVDKSKIKDEQIFSARALLKIGRYQETAIFILTQALLITKNDINDAPDEEKEKEAKRIRNLASEALSECGSEISMLDHNSMISKTDTLGWYNPQGQWCYRSEDGTIVCK